MYSFLYRNQLNNLIDCSEISSLIQRNAQLIDLRTQEEFYKEHIEHFINIPYQLLPYNLELIDKNKPVYLICHLGKQSMAASNYLNQLGYHAYSFIGGMYNYRFYANPTYY